MILPPPRSTRTYTLFPYTTLFRSNNGSTIDLRRHAEVEGAGKEGLPSGMQAPRVVGWLTPAGERIESDTCRMDQSGEYLMEIEFLGDYAIHVRCAPVARCGMATRNTIPPYLTLPGDALPPATADGCDLLVDDKPDQNIPDKNLF